MKFGIPKVVDPSPTPYVVPMTANNEAYVALDTTDQSHTNHHAGGVATGHIRISHVIVAGGATLVQSACQIARTVLYL